MAISTEASTLTEADEPSARTELRGDEDQTSGAASADEIPGSALGRLRSNLEGVRTEQQKRLDEGRDPPAAGLSAAQELLQCTIDFLREVGIWTVSLSVLFAESITLEVGGKASALLTPKWKTGRPPEHSLLDVLKGQLAAIIEYQQREGRTRREAREWVSSNLPVELD